MKPLPFTASQPVSRRTFLKTSSVGAVATGAWSLPLPHVFAAGSDELKVGIIGCGGRGTGAVTQALTATETPVKLWAMADLFQDRLEESYKMLLSGAGSRYDREAFNSFARQIDVPESRRFVGFDAYRQLLQTDVDLVLLTTPPGFRPLHFEAAVEAGKHVFLEKPVAVDPVGIRRVLAASAKARQRGLSVVAGTQRRHQKHYLEILERIHDGAIGDIVGGRCYWNSGGSSLTEAGPDNLTALEWQCRRWYYWTWLSGDHIVEQHVHNLDVMNWALQSHPTVALGMGGREMRQGGNIWDHFAVDIEYPGGVRITSFCRQMPGCSGLVAERIVGTKGTAYLDSTQGILRGENVFRSRNSPNPYVQEHADLIRSIRGAEGLNEGTEVAHSTLTAIMGRMSAYTGKDVAWDWALNDSQLDLGLPADASGEAVHTEIARPGRTELT